MPNDSSTIEKQEWSDGEIVADIRRVAHSLKKSLGQTLSRGEYYRAGGTVSMYFLYLDGRNWKYYCEMAGYRTDASNDPIPDDEYYERLRHAVEVLGRLPNTSERKKFGLNFSKRRWATLGIFIEDAITTGIISPEWLKKTGSVSDGAIGTNDLTMVELPPQPASSPATIPAHPASPQRPIPPVPQGTRRISWERTTVVGFPYAPHDESGTVALFAILCSKGVIPWQILSLNGGKGIDGVCSDDRTGKELRIELKFRLSRASWNHSFDSFDYLVCWESRWADFPKPVIELREVLRCGEFFPP